MIPRALVAACFVALSCGALYCDAASAQEARVEVARVGVMPVALPARASDAERELAERYTLALTEAIAKHRPDVITLGVPGDPAPSSSSQRERRALARAEGRRLATGLVVSAWLTGGGLRERLGIELLDEGGKVVLFVEVLPQRQGSGWSASVADRLRPHITSEAKRQVKPASPIAASAAAPATPHPAPLAPSPPTTPADLSAPPASSAAGTTSDVPLIATEPLQEGDDDGSALAWVLGSSGAVLVVGGVVALAVGGVQGALAWDESTRLVKLSAADPERGAMERSSLQKAMIADVLFVSAAVLLLAGGSAAGSAVFFLE